MLKKYSIRLQNNITLHSDDLIAIALSVIVGVTLSLMPHILWFFKTGSPVSFADSDDILYQSYATTAYHNHPLYLSDPVLKEGGSTIYPWLQFIPGVIITKLLDLNPLYINIIWRLWAGISIPIAWYLVTRSYLKNSWLSLGSTIILMTDIEMLSSWLVSKHFITVSKVALGIPGTLLEKNPQLLDQWRIITPGMSLAYLLIYVWLFHLALSKPTRIRILLAAASLGLLFYIYFYFWTSAILGLVIGILIDIKNRKTYLSIGIGGLLLGLPQVVINALIKHNSNSEWLPRIDNFLPISHFSELLLPVLSLSLIIGTFFWVIFRRRDLVHIWSLAAAAILLTNHQIVTGLQIQNFHWKYCYGPILSLLVILIFLEEIISLTKLWKKPVIFAGIALISFYLTTGIWIRYVEASQTKESVELTNIYHRYKHQVLDQSNVNLKPRSVIAGDKNFVYFAVMTKNQRPLSGYTVDFSPAVDNAEWDARIALNDYLQGINRSRFITKQETELKTTVWGPWVRDAKKLEERFQSRQKYYDEILANPVKAFKKFQVKYVALSKNTQPPEYLNNGWKLLQDGQYWQIWENKLDKSA
jgi:hypothetical protein